MSAPNLVSGNNANIANVEPAIYARKSFVNTQRIIGVALIALGCLTATFNPLVGGGLIAFSLPLIALGSAVIGSSLIQQVIGNAPGCEKGQFKRIFAGAILIAAAPIGGWIPASILWHFSNVDNC